MKKEADRFLTTIEVSKVHALFGEAGNRTESKKKLHDASDANEQPSGCFIVAFKTQLKSLNHVVTFQSQNPLASTESQPNPIGYFEVKILSLETKEP